MRYARIKHTTADNLATDWAVNAGSFWRLLDGAPWQGGRETGRVIGHDEVTGFASPVQPSKIICVGRNYGAHAKELGNAVPKEPLLFFKPPSSLIGADATILLPTQSERVDYEAELAVVLGHRLRKATREQAAAAVFGVTCANDVTARDLQQKDGQWARAKGFDTFCAVGPCVVSELPLNDREVRCRLNGEQRQHGNTGDLVFDVPTLLAYISAAMTLEPGDLVLTGTPEGIGPLQAGDVVEVEVTGVGTLRNHVSSDD